VSDRRARGRLAHDARIRPHASRRLAGLNLSVPAVVRSRSRPTHSCAPVKHNAGELIGPVGAAVMARGPHPDAGGSRARAWPDVQGSRPAGRSGGRALRLGRHEAEGRSTTRRPAPGNCSSTSASAPRAATPATTTSQRHPRRKHRRPSK
jgi:hypothetical protein